ncbi:MAG: alpha/beta hydrolase family esterase [Ilumatobacteraceae bacterium]
MATVTPCRPPGEYVSTASGRRVLLRAHGLAGPSATIIVVHGYTGTPTGIERYAELTEAANQRGITVAYPEGTATPDGGFGWNTGAEALATEVGDDVAALGEMMDAIVLTGCVDPARIILVGESNGGGMALVAACTASLAARLSRVVLVNAAIDRGVLARCSGGGVARALTAVAGAQDETVPIAGNEATSPLVEWFTAASSTVAGCVAIEAAPPLDAVVSRTVGSGCSACSELLLIADGTHTWPGSSRGNEVLVPGSFDLTTLLIAAPSAPAGGCLTGLP